ncbi:MAG TPA: exodeoxyribonuclease VII large subunit [Bryobacteraceae bacterium]|jgi:exodeoxyribonuclease VII large subunit|nr:exodeoxyribonuclease VII large subunit [Bryobacteraceae bacterium]
MKLTLEAQRRVFRVSELNAAVQEIFQAEFRGIWVVGEISGCRLAPSGHHYFSLKDEESQIKCVLFKGSARFARFKPQDGLAVIARGNVEVYEARGEYQLIVEMLEPQGAGALQLAFEQLKRKLAAEGLFEPSRKRPLPALPRRIGIVSSPGGAVIQDILHVLERRFQGLHVRLFPAQVQGEGSVEQVCRGIGFFSAGGWADVLIVARGGGSLEDLWTFNEEAVARAIAGSAIPVISAVGHETDFTIADFVADCRAPTPSAAAEIVICTRDSLLEQVAACRTKALQGMRYRLLSCSRDLHRRGTERAGALVHRALTRRAQRVDDLEYQLRDAVQRGLDGKRRRVADLARRLQASDLRLRFARNRHREELLRERLVKSMQTRLWHIRRQQESLSAYLSQLSPLVVLGRGYAIVENANKQILRAASEAAVGEQVKIRLHRGELDATVSAAREEV